jgi:hypothetical protein
MKRIVAVLAPVLLVMLALNLHMAAGHDAKQDSHNSPPPSRAVILRCSLNGSIYVVTATSVSTDAPSVAVSSSCGQALADLRNAGFGINDSQLEQSTMSLVYTLTSSSESNSN